MTVFFFLIIAMPEMLHDFVNLLSSNEHDLLTGWNAIPILHNRFAITVLEKSLSPKTTREFTQLYENRFYLTRTCEGPSRLLQRKNCRTSWMRRGPSEAISARAQHLHSFALEIYSGVSHKSDPSQHHWKQNQMKLSAMFRNRNASKIVRE